MFSICELEDVASSLVRKFQESKRPRIYVYGNDVPEVQELSQGASFCAKGQWGMEARLHHHGMSRGIKR